MPRIVEYTSKDDKLTPLGEGETAWTGAGRRIAPAYNEAATLIRESERGIVQGGEDIASATGLGVKGAENVTKAASDVTGAARSVERAAGEQTAAGKAQGQAEVLQADQVEKLEKAFLSQYKDLFDIGEGGATKAARGGGGGVNVARGGRASDDFGIMNNRFPQDYGAGNEILNGAAALTSKVVGNKGPRFADIGGDDNAYAKGAPRFFLPGSDTPMAPGFAGPSWQMNPNDVEQYRPRMPDQEAAGYGGANPQLRQMSPGEIQAIPQDFNLPGSDVPLQDYQTAYQGMKPNAAPSSAGIDWSQFFGSPGAGGAAGGNPDSGF